MAMMEKFDYLQPYMSMNHPWCYNANPYMEEGPCLKQE